LRQSASPLRFPKASAAFRKRLLEAFEGTYEGHLKNYRVYAIAPDLVAGTTTLSQKQYKEILRSYGYWDIPLRNTPMKPNTRLSKDDCDPNPNPDSTAATVAL